MDTGTASTSNFLQEFSTDDPRLGSIIKTGTVGDVVLVGFPSDEGVRRNGGRLGAAGGPNAMRQFLPKLGTIVNMEYNADLRTISVSDDGNVDTSSCDLEVAHQLLQNKVFEILSKGKIPFVVGGGNDQSYPNASALLQHTTSGSVGVINIDAHLDVRPLKEGKAHSGSPFRLLLENKKFLELNGKFTEFASQGSQCSAEHWKYVLENKNCNIVSLTELRNSSVQKKFSECLEAFGPNSKIFVSFDIDSIASCDAPGVSAPSAIGLTAQEALDICFIAGKHPNVCLFDLSEYNPVQEEYRTGRLVTWMFYYFLLGFSKRTK